jgi:uncharacterized protein (TIGR03437 family)
MKGKKFEMIQRHSICEVRLTDTIRIAFLLAGYFLFQGSLGSPSWAQTVAVVNGASFRTDQPVAPGAWVSGFAAFTNVSDTQNTVLPLPTSLGGVTVTVAGVPAPLNFVGPLQVNFVIPYGTAPGLHPVVVTTPGGTVNGTVRVISAAPGIFKLNEATPARGAILNEDNSLNAQDRPAIRGQAIQIFATGHDSLAQQIGNGAAAPTPPISTQVLPRVFIGGVECIVEFSGLAPGFAALWQINVRVPQLAFLAGRLPVQVFMNGVDSNEVTIDVAQ